MATQAELIEKWNREAGSIRESLGKDPYMSRETEERLLEREATLTECARELSALTY